MDVGAGSGGGGGECADVAVCKSVAASGVMVSEGVETHVGSEWCCLRGAEGEEKREAIGGRKGESEVIGGGKGEDMQKGALETVVPVGGGAVGGGGGGERREGAGTVTVCSHAPAHKVGEFCPQALPPFLRSLSKETY